jgi:hypothetical protein
MRNEVTEIVKVARAYGGLGLNLCLASTSSLLPGGGLNAAAGAPSPGTPSPDLGSYFPVLLTPRSGLLASLLQPTHHHRPVPQPRLCVSRHLIDMTKPNWEAQLATGGAGAQDAQGLHAAAPFAAAGLPDQKR